MDGLACRNGPGMTSDDALARRAARGELGAFEAIYKRYHQDLYRFCLAMVGDTQDAQDALQNTMVKVLRALPGEKREIRLKPWLYRIARNESVETLRKRRDSAEIEQHEPAIAGLAETAEARERLRTLLGDLEQLPERQRAALVMRELAGLDYEQIGAAFDSSAAVARQTLYEARLSLRQLEAGREMRCAEVMRELSDADGRVTRRREIQAHLRSCAECRAFRDDIGRRHQDLAALAPLPLAASAGLLEGVLGHGVGVGATGGGAVGGTGAAGAGAGAGKAVATSALAKVVATAAVVAVGIGAADRSGLVDLPPSGGTQAVEISAPAGSSDKNGPPMAPGDPVAESGVDRRSRPAEAGPRVQSAGVAGTESAQFAREKIAPAGASPGNDGGRSAAGENSPGGGQGRSASKAHGRPEQLPDAARHGQETAAAHKAEQAPSPPPQTGSPPGKSAAAAKGPPPKAEPHAPPVQAPAPVAEPAAPDVESAGRSGDAPGRDRAPQG